MEIYSQNRDRVRFIIFQPASRRDRVESGTGQTLFSVRSPVSITESYSTGRDIVHDRLKAHISGDKTDIEEQGRGRIKRRRRNTPIEIGLVKYVCKIIYVSA